MRLLVGVGADVDQHLVPAVAQTRVHRGGSHPNNPNDSSHLALKPLPLRAQPSQ